jgi:hypothetical protein
MLHMGKNGFLFSFSRILYCSFIFLPLIPLYPHTRQRRLLPMNKPEIDAENDKMLPIYGYKAVKSQRHTIYAVVTLHHPWRPKHKTESNHHVWAFFER